MIEQPMVYSFDIGFHQLDANLKNELFTDNQRRLSVAKSTAFFLLKLEMFHEIGGLEKIDYLLHQPPEEKLTEESYSQAIRNLKAGILNVGIEDPEAYLKRLIPEHENIWANIMESPLISQRFKEGITIGRKSKEKG